jgi:hypothetical protein
MRHSGRAFRLGILSSITAFIFSGCVSSASKHNQTSHVEASNISPLQSAGADRLGCIEKDRYSPTGLRKAWRSFIADGRYRIAREDDFSLPDIAIAKRLEQRIKDMRERGVSNDEEERRLEKYVRDQYHQRTVCPVMGAGDFNHDGQWYDLAVIIVDTTRIGLDRFGLLIFNRQKNDDETYIPHWLYKNRDLSKTVLNAIRDDLIITELREDGSMVSCLVKWNIKQNSYSCVSAN